MGEYAEISWQRSMYRGIKFKTKYKGGRNEVKGNCPFCGKGIRHDGGDHNKSMVAHIKDKRCDIIRVKQS